MAMKFKIKVKWTWCKRSKCWIVRSKKCNISGYGKTRKQAKKMFRESLKTILKFP